MASKVGVGIIGVRALLVGLPASLLGSWPSLVFRVGVISPVSCLVVSHAHVCS